MHEHEPQRSPSNAEVVGMLEDTRSGLASSDIAHPRVRISLVYNLFCPISRCTHHWLLGQNERTFIDQRLFI